MDLPWDVICIIIEKLPVKTLLRFRTVSKTWYNLIQDRGFRKLYTKNPLPQSSTCFILSKNVGFNGFYLVDKQKLAWKKTLEMSNAKRRWQIVAACNGLVCITDLIKEGNSNKFRYEIYIYNPITREREKLPVMTLYKSTSTKLVANFGYDAKTKRYKVAVILDYGDNQLYIFTVGEESWRKVYFPRCIMGRIRRDCGDYLAAFSNGEFFWIIVEGRLETSPKKVLVMDISDEKFRVVELEFEKQGPLCSWKYDLLAYEQYVTLVVTTSTATGKRMQVWELVDSKQGCWTRQRTHNKIFKEEVDVICAVGDDRLLLKLSTPDHSPSSFVIYSLKTGKVSSLLSPDEDDPEICSVFSFLPTFVSLEY